MGASKPVWGGGGKGKEMWCGAATVGGRCCRQGDMPAKWIRGEFFWGAKQENQRRVFTNYGV
jgi:hypothetical protein